MASLIDRIDNLGAAKSYPAIKSGESFFSYGYGGYIPSGDLTRDEYGAAAAYAVIAEVLAAIAVWETFLDGVTWVVRDKKTGAEIARTDKQIYPLEERGGKWFAAVKRFESRYFHSFWKSLAFSDWLYGNSYIALLHAKEQYRPTHTNYSGLKWLNPLNTSPMIINGQIKTYNYSGMDSEAPHQIEPQDMAYRINRRDAFNDLYGYSGVLSAMDAINLSRNTIRAFKNFFSNGMQLGGVISPVDQDVWSERELESARREWASNHKGAANAGRWAVIPKRASITPFGQEDASSNFTVTKDLRNQIFMALSVPPQLAGDPSDATYDNAKDIKRQWWETFAIPYAKDIAGFNSTVVIPKLEPDAGVYIEADTSAYEIEDPDVISQDINAGIIDISTARMKRGYAVDKDLEGIYVIAGRPMSKVTILSLANTLPASEVQATAQAGKYEAEAEQIATTPVSPEPVQAPVIQEAKSKKAEELDKPAYAYVPLPNQSDVLAVQRELRKLYTDEGIEWQMPPTFHITLCYAGVMSDEAISKAVSLLNVEKMQFQPVQGNGLDSFDTPDGKALHIRIAKNTVNDAMQADVYSAFMTEAYDLSEFSLPANWNPHITLAYIPNEIKVDLAQLNSTFEWLDSVVIDANQVVIGRDDYEPVVVVTAPEYKSHKHSHDHLPPIIQADNLSELDELQQWRKFIINGKASKRPFEQKALRGDIGDLLQIAVDSHDKQSILDAFKAAQERIEARVKAIAATRLDYENDFNELLGRARSERMQRVQWASAMRAIDRRYVRKAYVDGMTDGGVEDDPSEDDLISMNEITTSNSAYITELGNVLFKEDGISDAQADVKAAMWFNKSIEPAYQAGLLSADANGLYEWVYGDTEHCEDCKRLNGQRHRLKGWKAHYLPKSELLDCKGFACACSIVKVKGRQRGNY